MIQSQYLGSAQFSNNSLIFTLIQESYATTVDTNKNIIVPTCSLNNLPNNLPNNQCMNNILKMRKSEKYDHENPRIYFFFEKNSGIIVKNWYIVYRKTKQIIFHLMYPKYVMISI